MKLLQITMVPVNAAFERLTGYPSRLTMDRTYQWELWVSYSDPPWGIAELELVIRFIQRHMQDKGKQSRGYTANSLRFQNLIRDRENFESLVGIARAESRVKQPTGRDEVLQATGRPQTSAVMVKTPAQAMANTEALKAFQEWKRTSGLWSEVKEDEPC